MDGQLNQQMYFQIEMQLKVSSSKGTLGGVYFQKILQSLLASGFGYGLPIETSWYEFFHVVPK